MKKLPILTAAAVATGVALLAPTEAKACENCEYGNGNDICWTEASGFGACYVEAEYDECGEETGRHCMVYFDAWCDEGSGGGWNGPMNYDEWGCYAWGLGCWVAE
jgi:hypothetical protein